MGHQPVLADVVTDLLVWDRDGLYVDGTIGCANHALRLLDRLSSNGRLWGFDWDQEMLEVARMKLKGAGPPTRLFHEPFSRVGERLQEEGLRAHGIFLDLGLNSAVLDRKERGFRYRDADAPLDMRMDRRRARTAAHLLREISAEDLIRLLRDLGEVRRPRAVARAILQARAEVPLETAGDLVTALRRGHALRGGVAELSRVYQALRLAVNEELEELDRFLADVASWVIPGGRLVVLSYESLSDRRVKALHRPGKEAPAAFRLLTRRVVRPDREEIRANPRARSAKLRAMERTA